MSYSLLGDKITLKLRSSTVAICTVLLPLSSFVTCVLWSLRFNFEESTATHCKVANYLPSVSAAIGGFTPQRYIWRIGIALHAAPRFLAVAGYYRHFLTRLSYCGSKWIILSQFACLLHFIENMSLIGLTYVSSSENYEFHEKFFITFMVCSELYMILSCYLSRKAINKSLVTPSGVEAKAIKWKKILAATNIGVFLLAAYCFMRHNRYCEPGMYTYFALCEYIVVLTNMAFHMTAYWDFYGQVLILGTLSEKLS